MKNLFKKLACIALAASVPVSMAACGGKPIGGDPAKSYDDSKTQLRVFNYNGGVGSEWLDKVAARFEEDYKDYKIGDKTGVEIVPEKSKKDPFQNLPGATSNVIFSEIANYSQLVGNKELLDLSDIMDTPLNELTKTTDTATLKSKMYDETIDFYSFSNDKIYAMPHYAFFSALTYNKQLMIDKNLYFAKEYDVKASDEAKFVTDATADKSCGPDGVYGTDDDGLPATYDELYILFNQMVKRGVTPLTASGQEMPKGYINYLLNNVYLSLAGKEEAMLNYTFDSKGKTVTIVESFDKDGNPVTKQEVITSDNYKTVNKTLAKYQAIEIVDKILDTATWQTRDFNSDTTTMLNAQQAYIESYNKGTPTAMIIEGSYWYNEAEDASYIEDTANRYADFADKNDYQILPLPRVYHGTYKDVEGKQVGKSVYADQADSIAVINANIASDTELVKLAKAFIAYCYTDESLKEFTETTGVTRTLKYSVDETKLSDWGKAVWNYTKASDVVLPYSRNQLYLNNRTEFSMHVANKFWSVNSKNVYTACKGSGTAQSYFTEYMSR